MDRKECIGKPPAFLHRLASAPVGANKTYIFQTFFHAAMLNDSPSKSQNRQRKVPVSRPPSRCFVVRQIVAGRIGLGKSASKTPHRPSSFSAVAFALTGFRSHHRTSRRHQTHPFFQPTDPIRNGRAINSPFGLVTPPHAGPIQYQTSNGSALL